MVRDEKPVYSEIELDLRNLIAIDIYNRDSFPGSRARTLIFT